jgi:hypothetical protein
MRDQTVYGDSTLRLLPGAMRSLASGGNPAMRPRCDLQGR